jgi:hypothetical protein
MKDLYFYIIIFYYYFIYFFRILFFVSWYVYNLYFNQFTTRQDIVQQTVPLLLCIRGSLDQWYSNFFPRVPLETLFH